MLVVSTNVLAAVVVRSSSVVSVMISKMAEIVELASTVSALASMTLALADV